jgi:glycine/serine hydroxymethyltransferase
MLVFCCGYVAAVAVALKEAQQPAFSAYMKQVKSNAALLARCLKAAGCTLATGGTSNHIVLWDARNTGLSGAKLEKLLEMADIYVNKNTLPSDTSALHPSGVRLGTLAMTTRGVDSAGMRKIVQWILRTVQIGQEIEGIKPASGVGVEEVGGGLLQLTDPLKTPPKLTEFMERARQQDVATRLAQIRAEVNAFASDLYMPGPEP